MRFSQSVAYAIHAMVQLAFEDVVTPVPCSQLAAGGNMPERFLLQVLRDLTRQGLLYSTRGGGGGFTLARDPEEITLLDVVEAIDGPVCGRLALREGFPERTASRLLEALDDVAESSRQCLAEVNLKTLVDRDRPEEKHRNNHRPKARNWDVLAPE